MWQPRRLRLNPLRLYLLRWRQPRRGIWVDWLAVALIFSWGLVGALGGWVAVRSLRGTYPAAFVVLMLLSFCLGALCGDLIASSMVGTRDQLAINQVPELLQRLRGEMAIPLSMWERRLGVLLFSYFALLFPAVVAAFILYVAPIAVAPFWHHLAGLVGGVTGFLFTVGMVVVLVQQIRRYPAARRTRIAQVLFVLLALLLATTTYSLLSAFTQGALPSLYAVVPAYDLISGILVCGFWFTFARAALALNRWLTSTPP